MKRAARALIAGLAMKNGGNAAFSANDVMKGDKTMPDQTAGWRAVRPTAAWNGGSLNDL